MHLRAIIVLAVFATAAIPGVTAEPLTEPAATSDDDCIVIVACPPEDGMGYVVDVCGEPAGLCIDW